MIELIKGELEKREDCRQRLQVINIKDARTDYGCRFSTFVNREDRESFVQRLVNQVQGVNSGLEVIAGRNANRRQELVSLLVEQFEIEKELETKDPQAAGGFYHECCARQRLPEIASRIQEIIGGAVS